MGKRQEQCKYEAGCQLRSEFGCEVCLICTVGPSQRARVKRLNRFSWISIAINLTAFALNMARVFTRG